MPSVLHPDLHRAPCGCVFRRDGRALLWLGCREDCETCRDIQEWAAQPRVGRFLRQTFDGSEPSLEIVLVSG